MPNRFARKMLLPVIKTSECSAAIVECGSMFSPPQQLYGVPESARGKPLESDLAMRKHSAEVHQFSGSCPSVICIQGEPTISTFSGEMRRSAWITFVDAVA